jgi:sugar O-acyltransferase (sialic acid O-acetyltransferase NeuD family)
MHKLINLALFGGGGHCKSCIEVIESVKKFKIVGIIDNNKKINTAVLHYKIIDKDSKISLIRKKVDYALVTVGQIKSSKIRINLFNSLIKYNFKLPVIKSSSSIISNFTKIGKGSIIMKQAQIGPDTFIGENCIINNKALIEHDCRVKDHTHVSTGAVLNGNVEIGRSSFIGSGTIIKNNVKIGNNTVIGGGMYIDKDIGDNKLIKNARK